MWKFGPLKRQKICRASKRSVLYSPRGAANTPWDAVGSRLSHDGNRLKLEMWKAKWHKPQTFEQRTSSFSSQRRWNNWQRLRSLLGVSSSVWYAMFVSGSDAPSSAFTMASNTLSFVSSFEIMTRPVFCASHGTTLASKIRGLNLRNAITVSVWSMIAL